MRIARQRQKNEAEAAKLAAQLAFTQLTLVRAKVCLRAFVHTSLPGK